MWGFNPCFYGTTSSTAYGVLVTSRQQGVSILVFMERPLQPQEEIASEPFDLFQSLFLWNDLFNYTCSVSPHEIIFSLLFTMHFFDNFTPPFHGFQAHY